MGGLVKVDGNREATSLDERQAVQVESVKCRAV